MSADQPAAEPANNAAKPPIPSATVLLLRDGQQGLEVFMVVRHHQIDFASGALVFPGGKADPQDGDPKLATVTDGASNAQRRAVLLCAIRECFEECGVLLARNATGELVSGSELARLDQFRDPLHSGALDLVTFAEQEQLRFAADQLTHFAHWITPPMMPKRFDTHFYLAHAPADQLAVHDGHESVDSVWLTPQEAIAAAAQGTYTIIFPTLRNLEKLAQSNDVASAIAAARSAPVVPVLPWTEARQDATYLCIPTDAGYPVCEEVMPERN